VIVGFLLGASRRVATTREFRPEKRRPHRWICGIRIALRYAGGM